MLEEVIAGLEARRNSENIAGMGRFGINTERALGVSVKEIRALAKTAPKDHQLALDLWASGIHEARILASIIDRPQWVTEEQMDAWVEEFDSWDVCDQVCGNLFDRTPFAYRKPWQWAADEREFVRRAAFALIAYLAVHDKKALDGQFTAFFPLILEHATDERNFVKKAVNWALRQIGKRNPALRVASIEVAERLLAMESRSARWIARDALREMMQNIPSPNTL